MFREYQMDFSANDKYHVPPPTVSSLQEVYDSRLSKSTKTEEENEETVEVDDKKLEEMNVQVANLKLINCPSMFDVGNT